MIGRCTDPTHHAYKNYGGRGIKVCAEWLDDPAKFVADMGECPADMQLDRINNDGNYEPTNCRWVDRKTQIRNRRNTIFFTQDGVTKRLIEWSEELGVSYDVLNSRLRKTGKITIGQ
jgi:hypothetical protein